ncbi:MAG: amino acid transporter [Burkholderiaceae bacterium]|nr:amino acid transporter [Burkholderiaceae bacterium]
MDSTGFAFTPLTTGFTLSLSLIAAIGAQNVFVLRQGLRREHVGAVVATCSLLELSLMTAGVGGIGAALARHPRALDALAVAGACVLLFYAVQALRRAGRPEVLRSGDEGAPQSVMRVVGQVLAVSLLNPHVYLDTVVLVGIVGAQQLPGARPWFLLGAVLASTLWFAALGWGARLLRPVFARPMAWRVLDALVAMLMAWLAWGLLRDVGA